MKVPSFKKFLEEEDSKAIVQTGLNSKSIDNSVTKEIINSRLANATSNPFLTPYIALGSIARILAYVNIVVPQYTFLDRDEGEVVFDATQVGQIAGVNLDGSPARSEAEHFIYFSYSMNDEGYYDCFAALVDSDELEDIMDMGGDEDVDQFDVDQKVNEEQIDELSKGTLGSYALKAHRKGDLAKGMSKNANDDMGKIARRRYGGTQLAIRKLSGNAEVNATEELKGNQHKIDANKNGRIDADDFKKLRGEKSVDEGEDKKENKSKKNRFLRKLGYKDSPVDFTSPGNTAAMAVRAGRDKLKKEETQQVDEVMNWDEKSHAHPELGSIPAIKQPNIQAHQQAAKFHREMLSQARKDYKKNRTPENANAVSFHGAKMAYHNNHASIMKMRGMKEEPTNPAAQAAQELKDRIAAHKAAKPQSVRKPAAAPAPKSEPSVYDAAQKVKAAPQNSAAQELKARIAAHQQTKKK